MKWSKYNLSHHSEKFGHLLYNSLTNSFAAMDEATHEQVQSFRADPNGYDFSRQPGLMLQLLMMKAIVDDREEDALLNVIRMERVSRAFDTRFLELTIAPTLFCNLDCIYCYEQNRNTTRMSRRVEKGVVTFIKQFTRAQCLTLDWFGGEPLLRFASICRITDDIKQLGIPFGANLTTNGYLLTDKVASRLDDLKIGSIQVTVDGPEEVHDQRRPLISGKGTFATIVRNLDRLVDIWKGELVIRVNIDRTNSHRYHEIHGYLRDAVKGDNVTIRPGIVLSAGTQYAECLDRKDHAAFQVRSFREHGIDDFEFYPRGRAPHCTATLKNAYLIGPEGELYRCWMHLGKKDKVVGDIFDDAPLNAGRIADLMVGTDPFDDPACRQCFFLPICGGGCPDARLENRYADKPADLCLEFKDSMPEWLEAYYEIWQKQEAVGRDGPRHPKG